MFSTNPPTPWRSGGVCETLLGEGKERRWGDEGQLDPSLGCLRKIRWLYLVDKTWIVDTCSGKVEVMYNALIFLQADWLFWQLPFQALFDFVEKFGSGDGRPGPVPKMWKVPFFIFLPIKLHKKSLIWWTMASLRPTQIPLKLYLILPNILIFAGRGGPSGVGQGVSGGSG